MGGRNGKLTQGGTHNATGEVQEHEMCGVDFCTGLDASEEEGKEGGGRVAYTEKGGRVVWYEAAGKKLFKRCEGASREVEQLVFDTKTGRLYDQMGDGGVLQAHHTSILKPLSDVATACGVELHGFDAVSQHECFQEGDEVEISSDVASVRTLMGSLQGTSLWHDELCSYCGTLGFVTEISPDLQTVDVQHHDGCMVTWCYAVCNMPDDLLLTDALHAVDTLSLKHPDKLKTSLKASRGPRRYTLERLRTNVSNWKDPSWHDKQLFLDTVTHLQSRRMLKGKGNRYRPHSPVLGKAINTLLVYERTHNRLAQAPILLRATERFGDSLLVYSYRHYMLTVIGCLPGLWERSPHWTATERSSVEHDIISLLESSFSPEQSGAKGLVASLRPSSIPPYILARLACKHGRELRRIPEELIGQITEYLIPISTLEVLRSRLSLNKEPQDEDDGMEHAVEMYQQALDQTGSVHDHHIGKGCLAVMGKDYKSAKASFREAMECHKPSGTPAEVPEGHVYLDVLVKWAGVKHGWVTDEDEGGGSAGSSADLLLQYGEGVPQTPVPQTYLTPTNTEGDITGNIWASLSTPPPAQPSRTTRSPPADVVDTLQFDSEEVDCTCGREDESDSLKYLKVLGEVSKAHPVTPSDPQPVTQRDLESNCVYCLYHMALCSDLEGGTALLEKAEMLFQDERPGDADLDRVVVQGRAWQGTDAAPHSLNGCSFMNAMVNQLLGLYYIAGKRYTAARRPFRVAESLVGSSLSSCWLAKLDVRDGDKTAAYERLNTLFCKLSTPPTAATLYYSDYARLGESLALLYFSLDHLDNALLKAPKRPALHQLRAGILADCGNTATAVTALSRSIMYTYQAVDLLHRAMHKIKLGMTTSAVEDLCACLLFQPTNTKALILLRQYSHLVPTDSEALLATFYSRNGYVAKAACLYQSLRLQPHNPHVYCRVSQFFFRLGNKKNVHNYWCNRAIENCPAPWLPLFKGLLAESARDYELAAVLFKEAIRNLPLEYECHLMLAYTLVSLHRYDNSIKVLQCALQLASHPSHCSIIYNNIGYNYRCRKMYHKALSYFDKSKEYIPHLHYTFFNPYSNASEIYNMMGEQQKAVDEIHTGLQMAIEVRPSMLEELLTKSTFSSIQDIFALCSQIKTMDPYNEFTYRYVAAVLWEIGCMEAGLSELDEGIELSLGIHALIMRGEVMHCFSLGVKAKGDLAMSLLLDPRNEAALRLYNQCNRQCPTLI